MEKGSDNGDCQVSEQTVGIMKDSERLTKKEITVDCGRFWQSDFPMERIVTL